MPGTVVRAAPPRKAPLRATRESVRDPGCPQGGRGAGYSNDGASAWTVWASASASEPAPDSGLPRKLA